MKLKNLVGAMVALVGVAFAGAALGDGGDILGVWPCDKYGTALDSPVSSPADPFNEQSRFDDGKAYFKVRFLNHNYQVTPHRWIYKKLWGSEVVVKNLAVGVLVSGVMKEAYCEYPAMVQGDRYTDFVFSYTVQPGDLALPMMLSGEDGKPFGNDEAVPLKLYWTGNYSIQDEETGVPANWWWTSESGPLVPEGRNADYDLSQAGICLKTFDFDGHNAADGTWTEGQLWRSVHKGSTTTVGRFRPSISVPWSMATNSTSSASVYLWSEDESSFVVTNGGDAVRCTVREVESGVKRQVAEIKIRAGKESYEFCIYGTAEDATPRNLILSGTPNLLYAGSGALVTNFLVRTVSVAGPLPPTVSVDVGASPVTARPDYKTPVTELYVDLTQPNPAETDLDIQIVPTVKPNEEGAAGPTRPWYDYIRFGGEGTDVSLLSKNVYTNPVVRIKAGETVPTLLYPGTGPSTEMQLVGGRVCVYALYGDDFSSGAKGQFEIRLDTTNLTARAGSGSGGFDGWANGCALAVVPEAPVVTPKRTSLEATQNSPVTFDLSVADLWGNLKDETGYQLYYQNRDEGIEPDEEKWQEVVAGAFWKVDAETGYLKRTKDGALVSPTITYTVPDKTYITWFYVKAPNGKSSAKDATGPNVTVKVKKAPTVTATITDEDGRTIAPSTKIDEGTQGKPLSVNFSLDGEENTSGSSIYAFLAPVGEACGCVDGDALTNVVGAAGVEIPSGAGAGLFALDFTVTDGKKLSGSKLQFDIVLCSEPNWNPEKEVTGYQKQTVYLTVRNVIPKIKKATMDAPLNSAENGGFMKDMRGKETEVPIGLPKEFGLSVDEPGAVDATNNFQIIWTVQEANGVVAGSTITGTKNSKIPYTFTGAGTATFTVQVRDKDMDEGEELETFYFFVNVSEKPSVTLSAPAEIAEDKKGEIAVNLSDFGTETITGKVTVAANNTTETDIEKLGYLKLGGGALTPWRDESGEVVPNAFAVLFKGHADQTQATKFYIDECDGTQISGDVGFTLTVEIVDTRTNAVSKTRYCDYYLPATAVIKVKNVEPQFSAFRSSKGFTVDDSVEVSGNATNVAANAGIGEKITIDYSVSDIPADLVKKNISGKITGITVTWSDSEHSYDSISVTNSTTNLVFETKFMHPGRKKIIAVLRDEDLVPYLTRTWQIDVASAKTLVTLATGPGGGIADSTLSQRYAGAKGAGQGHTWANATFSFAEAFQINWNCNPDASSAAVWGFGYKVANPEDDGALDSEPKYQHDVPLSPKGNNSTESGSTELSGGYYTYKPDELYAAKLDSYLYGWISHASESDSGSGSGALTSTFRGIAPERGVTGPSSANAVLPSKTDNSNGKQDPTSVVYPTTYMEAVFAREYLPSDNMGDINADGIPDLYLLVGDYDFRVVDLTTGELTGNDQRDLNFTEGKDPEPYCLDYLPTTETAVYSHLIPRLPKSWGGEAGTGKPFIPRLKIRGFDETDPQSIAKRGGISASALNDAPIKWVGIAGVKPDQIYTNPREDEYSTLNYVEWLAWQEFATAQFGADAVTNKTYFTKWSPERPTNPTRKDTDGDGLTDGYEYYFWYMAHVGWVELDASGNEIHRRLTGRAYNPRNPGEGDFIDSETLASAFDPLNGTAYKLRDTDNDGLPDALEFLIGTNPIDFDSDGDGLPDGWEIMIAGTDPLSVATYADALSDTERNLDGDAMAISSYALEAAVQPMPANYEHAQRWTFAVEKATGDTDGVQWYAMTAEPEIEVDREIASWHRIAFLDGVERVCMSETEPTVTADGRLATDVRAYTVVTWKPAPTEDVPEPAEELVRGYPVRIPAGTPVMTEASTDPLKVYKVKTAVEAKDANACWIYGKGAASARYGETEVASTKGYGFLALARQLAVDAGAPICALPAKDRDVAYLHFLCYQEFGFDPRTAWKAKDPLAVRWSKNIDGESVEGITKLQQGGHTGKPTRTRDYMNYDEFLVCSFFVCNCPEGEPLNYVTYVLDEKAPEWARAWGALTTNPQGPADAPLVNPEHYYGRNSKNGADTDLDGVPDGWELYVMAGPKCDGAYVFAPPYDGFETAFTLPFADPATGVSPYRPGKSFWSPFVDSADTTDTSNQIYLGGEANDDLLNEYREFEGTDTMAYYADFSETVVHKDAWQWINKFFPTDPWAVDTDGDGLSDAAEKAAFAYGTPADDGKLWSIPGGGLNPCSVDTDLDGLPDGWENQFKGKTVYADDAEPKPFRAKVDGAEVGNPLEGLTDGMDGTVPDAYNVVNGDSSADSSGSTTWTIVESDGRRWSGHVDRDYDHDGLENWQEYLVGTMRCWRYDDPFSPWTAFDESVYFDAFGSFDAVRSAEILGIGGDSDEEKAAAFWYETLVNAQGQFYNPHFITGMSPAAQYFSRVTNAWDTAYLDAELSGGKADGAYYYFKDRVGGNLIKDTWSKILPLPDGSRPAPGKYISCSPVDSDTDCDGMDDYYELFHGLNPLLGASGVEAGSGNACDIVFDAWRITSALEAYGSGDTKNYWQRNPWKKPRGTNGMDFEVFPYLNGLWEADPDGDNDRNGVEFLSTREKDIGSHTDPTPLWMTDSSYSNSLTRLHYRIPTRANPVVPFGEGFTYNDVEYKFSQFDGWGPCGLVMGYMPFNLDSYWSVTAEDEPNWMFSFEENEGFDTDHDALGDREERDGLYRAATDPLDADSPRRRQAMYFQGPSKPSALQTMPEVREEYPVATKGWPTDPSFLNFTVECWAKPEDPARDQTVVERAVWTDPSNLGDQEYLRKNFQIALRGGKWMAKYDSGTLTNDEVKAFSREPAEAKWTHLAATFDGSEFRLYVDGVCQNGDTCGVKTIPENGVSAYAFVKSAAEGSTKRPGDYAWDVKYECKAILVGASFKGSSEGGKPEALDVTSALGWDYYRDFFQGYVDEIRIWDGARTSKEIGDDMLKRYTAADAKANRDAFYGQWTAGEDRYAKATTVRVVPELRYHFHFDSVPGAADAASVMKVPTGFQNAGGKPVLSRPVGYAIDWFATVVGGYGTVYGPDCDWVQWIPNTVAHLPRYDGTTLDSFFWSEEYSGKSADDNKFERSAEPVSRWAQMVYNGANTSARYRTTPMRHHFVYEGRNASTNIVSRYSFSGRHLNQMGDDLLPLGGAFVKYAPDLWDGQGPSSQWEHTGDDTSANMLPDWYEEYVRHTYGLEGEIEPDTDVTAFGRLMKVRELYLRDLARGIVLTADGKTSEFDPARVQIADSYMSGVPDWWMEFYRIGGESGLADHDNDGLPNYVEYLLSEVFDFEVVFDPTVADSVQPGIPDYFYRVGELYVGEIFTDHDRMYDAWEDLYPVEKLSRLAFDAYGDPDGDGWANVSEMLAGTDPTLTRHQGIENQIIADYPVPMIRTRMKIPDNLPESTPIVVQSFSKSIDDKFDAIWKTGASQGSFAKTKFIGTNPGGVRRFYLSPGSISPGRVGIAFNDENAVTYTYTVIDGKPTLTKSVITGSGWYTVVTDKPRSDDNSIGDLVKYTDEVVGWINYVTGEIELDFTCDALQRAGFVGETGTAGTGDNAQATESSTEMDLTRALVRFSWSAMLVKQGSLSDLYLSDADEGYVREGKNTFIAWADIDGSGTWQPGEPYGIVRDVDVSWSGTTAEIELTDLSPVTPRILLAGSSEGGEKKTETKKEEGEETEGDPDELDQSSDRGRTLSSVIARLRQNLEYEYSGRTTTAAYSNALARLVWIDNNSIETTSFAAGEFREQRLRVVRWLINGVPAYRAGSNMRTVLDKRIRTDLKTSLTEADFLVGDENVFDLDWNDLYTEVINNASVRSSCGNVTEVSYLVVVGDGPADWTLQATNNYAVKALNTVIVRKFGKTPVKPVAIPPGAEKEETVHSANPTFKWTMDCPEDEGYTAFNVQVMDGTTLIWDSGKVLAPPRNAEGQYEWSAPLYVGDKTLKGEVFEDKKVYTWQVAMYNAKFSNAANYSNSGKFLMEVQTNGYEYGSANVAVRYFGPKSSYQKKNPVIRVRAYTSPDFTGLPVAAGYVADTDSVTNVTVDAANCTVIGIPEGTYYLQAFIDSDGNGVCDPWETQGYLCSRSQKEPIAEYLDPTAITFDSKVGRGDLAVIYLEDADSDGDGLPDAWEYAEFGSIEAKGVEKLTETKAGEFVANVDLSAAIAKPLKGKAPTAGLEGEIRNTMAKLRSPAGVSAATGIDPANIEMTDGGLEVKSEIDPETLTIVGFAVDAAQNRVLLKVGAETTADINPTVANFLNITVRKGAEVTVKVEHAASPAGPWYVLEGVGGTVTVDRAGADIEVNLNGKLPAQGYFRAKVEEK